MGNEWSAAEQAGEGGAPDTVTESYSERAGEYIAQLGSMAAVHPSDAQLVSSWTAELEGPVLDARCGPGHWTAHLAAHGVDVRGVDRVPAFILHAREAHPGVPFSVGSLDALDEEAGAFGGVLAWYSLIHHAPDALGTALDEFARILRPGGGLLVGFFLGDKLDPFDHAVTTAYRWPADRMAQELEAAGFEVIETHTRTGAASKPRPHGAILTRRRSSTLL
ncbi:class I SAM-dependent methyltransferase [Frondihabitans peucedani]|uniref:Class I SAM-dependent methyltransferase n=1 Tax=Frondihabitans peucedani TaxID=598626 RepID=A0ABP8E6N6_9MICO